MDGLEVTTLEVPVNADGVATVSVPDGIAAAPAPSQSAFTGAPGNFLADLAAIAAESPAQTPVPVQPSVPPVQAQSAQEPGQPATAPVTPVPEKFLNPDGTVSQEKIAKSTVNAEEAYQKYAEIERQLRQKQNTVAALRQGSPVPAASPQVPVSMPMSSLEIQVAQDLINEAAAAGYQMPQGQAIATAKVQVRLMEAKHSAEVSLTEGLRQKLDDQDRRRELETIKDQDPWVLSPEGIAALGKIRESYPHVNSSQTPWTAAYDQHLANQVKHQRLTGQVLIPTPAARTVQAPPVPVQAAPRVVVKSQEPNFNGMTSDQISAYAAGLGANGEAAFWAKRGFKF